MGMIIGKGRDIIGWLREMVVGIELLDVEWDRIRVYCRIG
jgi:hypothetical protein